MAQKFVFGLRENVCVRVSAHSLTPSSHTFLWSRNLGGLRPAISGTFRNRQVDIHTHFTLWLASCAEVRKEPGLLSQALFFFFFFITFYTISPWWPALPSSRGINTFVFWRGRTTRRTNYNYFRAYPDPYNDPFLQYCSPSKGLHFAVTMTARRPTEMS